MGKLKEIEKALGRGTLDAAFDFPAVRGDSEDAPRSDTVWIIWKVDSFDIGYETTWGELAITPIEKIIKDLEDAYTTSKSK